jgi:hypothetical protein
LHGYRIARRTEQISKWLALNQDTLHLALLKLESADRAFRRGGSSPRNLETMTPDEQARFPPRFDRLAQFMALT